ncbi:unnamed protein product [Orchesella dallaii]|uniref:MARVEL domain-containing protein n=1 Tax=Orchesella dallaii TaxID=48710 RepID=A0ABP1RSV6_9HEXA
MDIRGNSMQHLISKRTPLIHKRDTFWAVEMGGANCGYFCSTPGILKLITVIVVFFSHGQILYSYTNADYIKTVHRFAGVEMTEEQWCKKQRDSGAPVLKDKYCPIGEAVLYSVLITSISFWTSLIFYILHLIFELNNTPFKLIDWIGHFVGGLMMTAAGIVSIIYFVQAYYAMPCSCSSNPLGLCVGGQEGCERQRTRYYQPLYVLLGGICAIVSGVLFIAVGVAVKKQPSN